jgi:hypothetical protein
LIEIVEKGPFAGGSLVWRGRGGESVHTIVVKATYELAPLTCPIVDRPLPIAPNDEHDDGGDASASVRVPADLVPLEAIGRGPPRGQRLRAR